MKLQGQSRVDNTSNGDKSEVILNFAQMDFDQISTLTISMPYEDLELDDRAEAYRKPQVSKATKEVEQECQYDIITGKAILLLF